MSQPESEVGREREVGVGVRLRRRWWVALLGTLLGLFAAAVFTATQDVRYVATTSVLVLATDVDAALSSSRPDVNMDTESELVRSAQVAEVTQRLLATESAPGTLLAGLEVTVPLNSQVLAISYSDRTAASAQAGAQGFAQGYLAYRADEASKDLAARNGALQADLDDAQQQLRLATDKAAALPANSPDRVFAEAQRAILSNRITSLSARLSALQAASPTPGQIITAAALPDRPSSPTPRLNYAAGLLAGLLLGAALLALAERLDHTLRHPSDVARLVGQPVLLDVPLRPGWRRRAGDTAPAFDRLRNMIVARGELPRMLQVVDPGSPDATGAIAIGLAQSLVRATGRATLIIARDESTTSHWLGLGRRAGLSDVLLGTADLESVLVTAPDLPGVRILPAGKQAEALESLLQSHQARDVLNGIRTSGAPCVMETLGTGDSPGAQAVAAVTDGVLLVAERGVTDHRLVSASVAGARAMDAEVVGVVLVSTGGRRFVRQFRSSRDRAVPGSDASGDDVRDRAVPGSDASADDVRDRAVPGSDASADDAGQTGWPLQVLHLEPDPVLLRLRQGADGRSDPALGDPT